MQNKRNEFKNYSVDRPFSFCEDRTLSSSSDVYFVTNFHSKIFELKKGEIVSDIKNIFCKYCNEAFYTERAVNIHIMTYHDEEKERKPKKKKVEMDEGRDQRTKPVEQTGLWTILYGPWIRPDQEHSVDLCLKMRKLELKKSWPEPLHILLHVMIVTKDLPIFLA